MKDIIIFGGQSNMQGQSEKLLGKYVKDEGFELEEEPYADLK